MHAGGKVGHMTSVLDAYVVPKTKDGKCPMLSLNNFVCADAAGMKYQ